MSKKQLQTNNQFGILKLFGAVVKAHPLHFVVANLFWLVYACTLGGLVIFMQVFFDNAAEFAIGQQALSTVVLWLIGLIAIHLISQIAGGISNVYPELLINKAEKRLTMAVHKKIGKLKPECIEDAESLDTIEKAQAGIMPSINIVDTVSTMLSYYLPYFVFVGGYLFWLQPQLALILVVMFVPLILAQLIKKAVAKRLEDQCAPLRRQVDYYTQCLIDKRSLKETRMLGGFGFLYKMLSSTVIAINKKSYRTYTKATLIDLLTNLLSYFGFALAIFLLFDALMDRVISVGTFVAVLGSLSFVFSQTRSIILYSIGSIASDYGMAHNLIRFFNLEERVAGDSRMPDAMTVALDNVSFAYPNAGELAVSGISLKINNGQSVAIVGENGSGKTTLCRLILGLYTPTEGSVMYNDTDVTQLSVTERYKNITAVF